MICVMDYKMGNIGVIYITKAVCDTIAVNEN